jgi:hypothetical protein
MLDTYCHHTGQLIESVLGDMVDCIGEIECEEVEALARSKAKNMSAKKGFDERDAYHVGNLIFITLANINVVYSDFIQPHLRSH